ncbi:vesicle-associated protein 2-1-like isoform X1 [Zingiber officinale]|uniref:vesicle-associated protein 2-1-like isoform X1 n=1 Tax=Zingiber officinale TaxID=94328 RepID=UPI001C4B872D|nr:vesicle-associated protein 2-1-like isoform X1 [Zingiber officinale]
MRGGSGGQMISIYPEELSFEVELEKPSSCNIKVVNNTEHHVAFKVKTTSPKKYFVRPNASVVQPWDSCTVTVTLQAQKELPPDMQCKDKFLIQSAKVPPTSHIDEIPKDTFNKEVEKVIEDLKLRVVYIPRSENGHANPEEESGRTSDVLQKLKEERDLILHQNHQFKRELEMLNKRRSRKSDAGFSMTFAAFAGLIGITFGFILNLLFTASPTS